MGVFVMKLRWTLLWSLALVTVGGAALSTANACSRILWNSDSSGVYSSRSLDWNELMVPVMQARPRGVVQYGGLDQNTAHWVSKYGSVVIRAENYGRAVVDGLNEQGLAAHLLYLGDAQFGSRDERPGVSYTQWVHYVLDNFASVQEAVDAMQQVQIVQVPVNDQLFGIHLAIEDASGDSAIFEHLDGKLVVHHGRQYTVMTNDPPLDEQLLNAKQYRGLGGEKELPGDTNSADRFVRASYFLKHLPAPKSDAQGVAYMLQLIHNVSVPFGAPYQAQGIDVEVFPTWWVTAMDLKQQTYYFSATESPNVVWLDLKKVNFAEGQPLRELHLINPSLVGELSRALEPITSH